MPELTSENAFAMDSHHAMTRTEELSRMLCIKFIKPTRRRRKNVAYFVTRGPAQEMIDAGIAVLASDSERKALAAALGAPEEPESTPQKPERPEPVTDRAMAPPPRGRRSRATSKE